MQTIARKLAVLAGSVGSVYKIVFITMLIYELVKYKRKGYLLHGQVYHSSGGDDNRRSVDKLRS